MSSFRTEYEFTLPNGYVDETGTLHKEGIMRLATAGDEILPLKDPRVQQNPAYLTVVLLARVVVRLGSLKMINTKTIEELFSTDFAYLQELYNRINMNGQSKFQAVCPNCKHSFEAGGEYLGG